MTSIWHAFKSGVALLTARGQQILIAYGIGLILLAGLDGIALYLVSDLFTGSSKSDSIQISSGGQTLALVVTLFTLRTVFSTLLSWVAVKRFAKEEAQVGATNFDAYLADSWNNQVDSSVTDLYNTIDRGPNKMVQGLLLYVVTIIAEAATAVLILGALMFLQPITAIIAAIYFSIVALIQHRLLSHSSNRAGESVVAHTNVVYETLSDVHSLNKLLKVTPSQSLRPYLNEQRRLLAIARGRVVFLGMLPRYFMELILAFGLALIAGATYAISGAESAVAAVTVFAAAGFRLLPIVNRIQGLILQLFSTIPEARLAFIKREAKDLVKINKSVQEPVLILNSVNYKYPSASQFALTDVSIVFESGLQYAIVGPSGAGKSTFIDICLGLLEPQIGVVKRKTGTSVAYVPQETNISRTDLKENIALEWSKNSIDAHKIDRSIEIAQLSKILEGRIETAQLSGQSLSGGQKQRIGLARAIYRNPSLLFLDEVTSALDAETEHAVMSSINELRGSITVVIVAHRLSTVQHADRVVYIDQGKILGVGTFEELRKTIPQLQRQIELGTLNLLD
jgi:ABC-type multidrug transport system fused ATPase/permease subunit